MSRRGRPRGRHGVGIMGLLGLGEQPPRRVTGVMQQAVLRDPVWCPKCQSTEIFQDITEPRRIYCYHCHADWYRVGVAGDRGVHVPA